MDFSYLDDWLEEEEQEAALPQAGEGYRHIWVIAESTAGRLLPSSLEVIGQARDLADRIGVYVYCVLVGGDEGRLGQGMIAAGADGVLAVRGPDPDDYQPELWTAALANLVDRYRPEILLLAATSLGNDLAPRLAQRLDTGLLSHCVKVDLDMAQRLLIGTSPALGGEVFHSFTCPQARPQMATLEPGHFPTPLKDTGRSGAVEDVEVALEGIPTSLEWLSDDPEVDLPKASLASAKIVVTGGRGMGDREGFALVEKLADALKGVVAGTRGAFDEGWIGEEEIVGIGGTTIAPDLVIACGVSGDIFHSFGLQDARFVVAINTDDQAPITKSANMAVVSDARLVIPAILETLAGAAP